MLPTRFVHIGYELNRHLRWKNLGPKNITCVVRTLAIHPTNSNVLYAGTPGGVWKTSDGGTSWVSTSDRELNLNVESLGISQSSPNTIYAGMNLNDLGQNMDLYRSDDSAATWDRMTELPSRSSHAIAIHPLNSNIVYIAGDQSLHKSADGGRSWLIQDTRIDGAIQTNYFGIFDGDIDDVKIDPDFPNTLYLAVRWRGIFKTIDGGNTWNRIGAGVNLTVLNDDRDEQTTTLNGSFRTLLAIGTDRRPGKHGTQFIVVKVQGTILISSNGGNTWRVLPGYDHGYDDQNWWDSCITISPADEDFIVAGGDHIDYTLNGSSAVPTWAALSNSLHCDQQSITFTASNPGDFYFANDGYIGKARNRGSSVDKVSDGLVASQCFNVSVSQTLTLVVGCSTYHTGTIRTGRADFSVWEWIDGPEGGLFEIDPMNENTIFNSPWGDTRLHRSRNGGTTWDRIPVTVEDGRVTRETYIEVIAIRPDYPSRIYAGGFFGRLHYTTDGGDTWDFVRNPDGSALFIDGGGTGRNNTVSCFAYSPSDGNYLYLGTNNGHLWCTRTGAIRATGWQELNTPYPPPSGRIGAIAVHPIYPDTIYVGYGVAGVRSIWRGVRQPNGTFNWTDVSGLFASTSIPSFPVTSLIVDWDKPTRIFAATRVGVFKTDNEGDSWEPFMEHLPGVPIVDMRLRHHDLMLYVAAYGRGIYRRAISATSKFTLVETSEYGPAVVVNHINEILLSWIGRDVNKSINFIKSFDGLSFYGKVTLVDSSDYGISVAYFNNRYIVAWTGRDADHHLNIMQSLDGQTWNNKRILGETSLSGPSLVVLNSRIFLSWRGQGNNWLNVMSSTDAINWENKVTLGETTESGPVLASSDAFVYLSWRGVGNNMLNILRSNDGILFSNKVTLTETTETRPALQGHRGQIYLSWEGVGNRLLNILRSNNGVSWDGKIILTETSFGGPALSQNTLPSIIIGWTGTDIDHHLNIIIKD